MLIALGAGGFLFGAGEGGQVPYSPASRSELTSATLAGSPGAAEISLEGHGYGPGYGMGQWGALGYALDGWSYRQILSHYYGGTTMASVTNANIRVEITQETGHTLVVTSQSAFSVAGTAFAPGQAAMITYTGAGTSWSIAKGSSCAASQWTQVGVEDNPIVVPSETSSFPDMAESLELCLPGDQSLYLGGDVQADAYQGRAETINIVPLETYVAGVVPAESPAGWGSLGGAGAQSQPEGFQELEAQAVAARSYVESGLGSLGVADICDTAACQVYGGVAAQTAISDLAVADTAGEVLDLSNGSVARTDYSASTGGYTAGGAFPPVVDLGDAVCVPNACNTNHVWRAEISVGTVEAAYPSIGTFENLVVTERNGYGDWGGRVEELKLEGSTGSIEVTGSAFAAGFGLRSDWFIVTSVPAGGVGGYWLAAADGAVYSFGDAVSYGSVSGSYGNLSGASLPSRVVAMAATPDGRGYWLAAADGAVYSFGDAVSYGNLIEAGIRHGAVALSACVGGHGFLVATPGGGVENFGQAPQFGDLFEAGIPSPSAGVVAMAVRG